MILKQFQKVLEIDERISVMHDELFNLYKERAQIIDTKSPAALKQSASSQHLPLPQTSAAPIKSWAASEYEKLAQAWQLYGVRLPEYSKLEAKLFAAHAIIEDVSALLPELSGKMGLLAVPPAKQFKFPAAPKFRTVQQLQNDLISAGLPKTKSAKAWRLLVVYDQPDGIYLDTPKNIVDKKLFAKANYDMTALGLTEYAALSLQTAPLIDQGTWTVLLNGYSDGETAPYATFNDSRYRFEMGQLDSQYGYVRFRPAIEVKL